MGNQIAVLDVNPCVLNELLRRHDGVVTLAQARGVGLSKYAVHRRIRTGEWLQCAPGVYFADDRPFDDAARIRAAVWSYGERAAASGLAAAWWHGVTKFAPDTVEVTVPRNSHGRCHAGSRVRRRDLKSADIVERRGLQVTAIALTAIEAAVRRGGGAKLLDTALQRHVELSPLWTAHLRNKGRYGSPAARRMLHAADDGARSAAERLLIQLLKQAGITGWVANYPVVGYRVDAGFPACKVAVETDGLAFHSDADDFHNDRVRQNAIALAGWQVLRFTWLDLTEYPERVIATIRHAIGRGE
jgi:very-short-patch-repair endonuclease